MKLTWKVVIGGRVQGVCYRAFTIEQARRLGVTGCVRNERNSKVTAMLQHTEEKVLSKLAGMLREGPPAAWVDSIEIFPQAEVEEFTGFRIEEVSPWSSRVPG